VSAFQKCFFFLRDPHGGVEDLARMKAAGYSGVFCNVGDHPAYAWEEIVRPRALEQGMFCGPWARTGQETFDIRIVDKIVGIADHWGSPLIVNSESEIDGTGSECTEAIAAAVGDREAAVSMQCWPFASVDWRPIGHLPVLPQIFPAESAAADKPWDCKYEWHRLGVRCVYFTFGSYADMEPIDFDLKAPYSIYTADDCGYDYAAWSPTSTGYEGCVEQPGPVPPDGDDMEKIGKQHGITGFANWLRAQPDAPQRGPSYDPENVDTWPWPDKIERTLNILAADHDEQADSVF
jgi:hypothetical protein